MTTKYSLTAAALTFVCASALATPIELHYSFVPTNGSVLYGAGFVHFADSSYVPKTGAMDFQNGSFDANYGVIQVGHFSFFIANSYSYLSTFTVSFADYLPISIYAEGTLNDTPGETGFLSIEGTHYVYSETQDDSSLPGGSVGPTEVSVGDVVFAPAVPEPATAWLLIGALPLLAFVVKQRAAFQHVHGQRD